MFLGKAKHFLVFFELGTLEILANLIYAVFFKQVDSIP